MSTAIAIRNERLSRIREYYAKQAYGDECKTGKARPYVSSATSLSDLLSKATDLRGADAQAAAYEIYHSKEELAALQGVMKDVPDAVLSYLYSSVCYKYFSTKYLTSAVDKGFSPLYHDPYFEILRAVETHMTPHPAMVCGPREWGKTTIGAFIMPMHAIIFPVVRHTPTGDVDFSKRYIVFISAAKGPSQKLLSGVCLELEQNDDIRNELGEFYKDPDIRRRKREWTREAAVTENGVRIECHSRKSKFRGAWYRGRRPDLIIGDDLEDDETTESENRRTSDFIWYTKIILPSIAQRNGNVLTLGNLDNPDGLCEKILKHSEGKNWMTKVFKVFETHPITGAKIYTWPEHFGADFEAKQREDISDEAFELEYQMNVHAAIRELSSNSFHDYDMDEVREKFHRMWLIGAVDQASGKKKTRHDETAIGGIAYDPVTKLIYVLPAIISKLDKKKQPKAVLDYHMDYDFMEVAIEGSADQGALCADVEEIAEEMDVHIKVVPVYSTIANKHERIKGRLYRRCEDGRILFPRGDASARRIKDQLLRLGQPGMKDDAADMLSMAVERKDKRLHDPKINTAPTMFTRSLLVDKGAVVDAPKNEPVTEDGKRLSRRQLILSSA